MIENLSVYYRPIAPMTESYGVSVGKLEELFLHQTNLILFMIYECIVADEFVCIII
jgi:hypothetical protein